MASEDPQGFESGVKELAIPVAVSHRYMHASHACRCYRAPGTVAEAQRAPGGDSNRNRNARVLPQIGQRGIGQSTTRHARRMAATRRPPSRGPAGHTWFRFSPVHIPLRAPSPHARVEELGAPPVCETRALRTVEVAFAWRRARARWSPTSSWARCCATSCEWPPEFWRSRRPP